MNKPETGAREMRAQPMTDATVDATDTGDLLFTGYAAVYEQPSQYMGFTEYVAAGAFERVLSTSPDVRMLGMNHSPDLVFARTAAGTLDLSSDAHGLKVEARIARTAAAEQLATSVDRGDVDAMSYGFAAAKDEWDETDPENVVRRLLDFRALYDVSPVAFPAFTQTEASFRSLGQQITDGALSPAEVRALIQTNTWPDPPPSEEPAADVAGSGMDFRASAQLRERRRSLLARAS